MGSENYLTDLGLEHLVVRLSGMATFYCRHTNQNTVTSHLPYPGTRVEADDKAAAALSFAISNALPINTKIVVVAEEELSWFIAGQVSPSTGPSYT